MKKIILISAVILICAPHVSFGETVSLSTYYPAPYGTYDRLRLVPRPQLPANCAIGTMYVSSADGNRLMFCRDQGGSGAWGSMPEHWTRDWNTNEIYLTDTNSVNNYRVGIGDLTPDAALEVSANGQGYDLFMASTNDNNDGDAFVVKANGNVGIGENNPQENLTVSGGGSSVVQRVSIESGAGAAWLRLTETNFRGGFLRYDTATGNFHIGVHSANDRNAAGDVVAITIQRATGNVDIPKVLTAQQDVTVNGTLKATGGQVNIGNVGDLSVPNQPLNVRGSINLRDNGSNWGRLRVQYNGGFYYAVYAP